MPGPILTAAEIRSALAADPLALIDEVLSETSVTDSMIVWTLPHGGRTADFRAEMIRPADLRW